MKKKEKKEKNLRFYRLKFGLAVSPLSLTFLRKPFFCLQSSRRPKTIEGFERPEKGLQVEALIVHGLSFQLPVSSVLLLKIKIVFKLNPFDGQLKIKPYFVVHFKIGIIVVVHF